MANENLALKSGSETELNKRDMKEVILVKCLTGRGDKGIGLPGVSPRFLTLLASEKHQLQKTSEQQLAQFGIYHLIFLMCYPDTGVYRETNFHLCLSIDLQVTDIY